MVKPRTLERSSVTIFAPPGKQQEPKEDLRRRIEPHMHFNRQNPIILMIPFHRDFVANW